MKRFVIIFVFFFLFPNWINAQAPRDINQVNGNDWRELPQASKASFIGGFMSGSSYVIGNNMLGPYGEYSEEKAKFISSRFVALPDNEMNKKLFSGNDLMLYGNLEGQSRNERLLKYNIKNITSDQICDGLNKLYEDFKNRGIIIPDAIYVVKKQIKGATEEEIDAILQYLRAEKDYKKLKYKNKSGETFWVDFP